MSLLLDALRRAGASRGDGFIEPVPERTQGGGSPSPNAEAGRERPADLPALDVEPVADDNGDAAPRRASAPDGPARAEAVFRGGASGRPVLRTAGLAVLGTIVVAGVLAGGAWYYYETARSEVDRELVRYTPDNAPAEPAGTGAASADATGSGSGPSSATADPDGTATTATAGGEAAQASAGTETGKGGSTPGEPASPASGQADAASSKPERAADTSDAKATAEPAGEANGAAASGAAAAGTSATADTGSGAGRTRTAGAGAERDVKAGDGGSPSRERASAQADTPATAGAASGNGSGATPGQQEPMVRTSESGGELGTALRAGYRALRNDDLAAAQRHYQRALDLAPANRDARLGAAAVAQRRGDDALAAKHYRRVLADHPRDPYARAGLAGVEGTADPRRSESELKGLLKDNPEAHALRFSLGNLYAREGRWAEAQSAYFEAFRDAPREADYAFNLAVALDQLDQRESAIRHYQRAVDLAGNGSASFPVETARRRLDRLQP